MGMPDLREESLSDRSGGAGTFLGNFKAALVA
jgi:hypothetical protein